MNVRLIPSLFFPLSALSYTSILGIVSLVLIVVVVFVDGTVKSDAPGSLWVPAETFPGIDGWNHLGKAFGLFMAGVGRLFRWLALSNRNLVCRTRSTSFLGTRYEGSFSV